MLTLLFKGTAPLFEAKEPPIAERFRCADCIHKVGIDIGTSGDGRDAYPAHFAVLNRHRVDADGNEVAFGPAFIEAWVCTRYLDLIPEGAFDDVQYVDGMPAVELERSAVGGHCGPAAAGFEAKQNAQVDPCVACRHCAPSPGGRWRVCKKFETSCDSARSQTGRCGPEGLFCE